MLDFGSNEDTYSIPSSPVPVPPQILNIEGTKAIDDLLEGENENFEETDEPIISPPNPSVVSQNEQFFKLADLISFPEP